MIYPTLEEIKSHSRRANVIPVCRAALADTETPVSAWMKFCHNAPYNFLLESADGGGVHARYSFIGANPYMTFSARGKKWNVRGAKVDSGGGDPVGALRKLLSNYRHAHIEGMPRFCGGAVGYFAYDAAKLVSGNDLDNTEGNDADDIFFGFYRDLIAFDNKQRRLLFISNIILNGCDCADEEIEKSYINALANIDAMMEKMKTQISPSDVSIPNSTRRTLYTTNIRSDFEKEAFKKAVEKCIDYIEAGDVSQVVVSRRGAAAVEAAPFDLYRSLRIVNPSPYMFFLSLDKTAVIGASPEMLVRVENGVAENRPIAGTRRRGETAEEDARLVGELKNDPKETAEHAMLVELGKSDLESVCVEGSVKAGELMRIEKYSRVMHLVTDLSGKLRPGLDALDALFACFPAGTLTGAPKARAMEIIAELEPSRRGIYGGALGYIDFSGNMDTCIVIRTIIFKDGVAAVQSGAGVVANSTPEREYQETVEKASALWAVVGAGGKKN